MATLWFSYSQGNTSLDGDEPLSSPYTIYWNVGNYLKQKAHELGYEFVYVNLDDTTPQTFSPNDIAIGHTWFSGGFMHQALDAGIKAFILQPYTHQMVSPGDVETVIALYSKATHIFAICGDYWFDTIEQSPYGTLKSNMTRLDMAINTVRHPRLKTHWNKPGKRAVCVIGNDTPTKGFKHVAELAIAAGFRLGHFGSAAPGTFDHVPSMTYHGGYTFTPAVIEMICQQYDALLCMPIADANPTVLLEAASWGLMVYCSRTAGYLPHKPFFPLEVGNMPINVAQMRTFQEMDEYALQRISEGTRKQIEREYTWDKFTKTLWDKVQEYL